MKTLRLSDTRIAIKLAMVSGLGILLVVGLIVSQVVSNSKLNAAAEHLDRQTELAQAAAEAKATIRGMGLGLRDARLAVTFQELEAADKFVNVNRQLLQTLIGTMRRNATQRDLSQVETLDTESAKYFTFNRELFKAKKDKLEIESKSFASDLSYEDSARVVALQAAIDQIARVKATPAASAMAAVADKLYEQVKLDSQAAKLESADVRATMAYIALGLGVFVVLVQFGTAIFGARSIARPLHKMASVLVDLTNDRIVDVPYATRGDEIGDIAKATEVFKQSIAQKVINLRVRSALDVVNSNVMLADDSHTIIYVNASLQKMLQEAEGELRKAVPNFDASSLIGAGIDIFQKNDARERQAVETLRETVESHFTVGSQKFQHIATPVFDQHGKRSGTVVEWRNETLEKAIENEVDDLVKAAVAGDFAKRVPLDGKKGFMLNLATAMNGLCENTGQALQDLAGMLRALADGDLTKRIAADYQGMFGDLKDNANKTGESIATTVREIKISAAEVTNASGEISTSTTNLSQRTEEQAASLEETSASMEQIAATVKKNAESAQHANASAATTQQVANRGGEVVAKAVDAMARIEESSRKISDIIGVIDEIARQTNLLALNAAVEAARAGEAGRGFAVVASEVRSLAQRASQAAKDIKDLITNSNSQVKDGVDLVNRAGASLAEIVGSIKQVAEIVADIANASAEQASGIEQVNKALTNMDEVTQQNSALVEENAATAKTLEQQARAMDERIAFFRIDAALANEGSKSGSRRSAA